ncbi:ABC transporter permease [Halovulum marinum]
MVRESLALLLPEGGARLIKTAPLTAVFGMLVIAVYILTAVFAPAIAPYGEAEVVGASFQPADETMLLGGDQLGRDLFSRLIFGARNTVGIALVTTAIAFVIGTLTGLIAASMGGWVDQILGRIVDTLLAIPQLIFALLLLTITGPSVRNLTLVIALLYAPLIFRLARAVAGGIVVMDYIEAARLRGERTWYVIMKEVLPNVTAPLAAEFGLRFCFVFLAISALSFLGLGIQPPTADWGSMVRENATLISFGAITPLIPAAAIALLTVAVNFVVDWMLHISSGLKE